MLAVSYSRRHHALPQRTLGDRTKTGIIACGFCRNLSDCNFSHKSCTLFHNSRLEKLRYQKTRAAFAASYINRFVSHKVFQTG